ncbi:sigma-70 family RNA polymerase sigma factor [Paludibacter sp.]|uniref:sigma-70 family RNA polymerase sigma factor n=1 Tax=Paludibacter sp. TaxID=1898105 RepID=UPI001355A738|nr:sigma-70 family RNA polymerase sigma factor [Paludibacter sp.]MTK53106.1 sigma-70 family RNA polymerase sigma factor [Paludibacter sp.]
MTDQEIVQGLIDRNNTITQYFFFEKCQPLFRSIMRLVFSYKVDYNEFVNELYQELLDDDAYKLRQFDYRSTFLQWLKVVAIRYFIRKRNDVIEDVSKEILYNERTDEPDESENKIMARMDVERLLGLIDNKRYVYVLQKLMIEGVPPESLAKNMDITPANLYNIKKRAILALTHIVLNDIKSYVKR